MGLGKNTIVNNDIAGLAGNISAAKDVTGGENPVDNVVVKGNTGQGMGATDPNLIATVNGKNLVKSSIPTYTTGGVDQNAFPPEILTQTTQTT